MDFFIVKFRRSDRDHLYCVPIQVNAHGKITAQDISNAISEKESIHYPNCFKLYVEKEHEGEKCLVHMQESDEFNTSVRVFVQVGDPGAWVDKNQCYKGDFECEELKKCEGELKYEEKNICSLVKCNYMVVLTQEQRVTFCEKERVVIGGYSNFTSKFVLKSILEARESDFVWKLNSAFVRLHQGNIKSALDRIISQSKDKKQACILYMDELINIQPTSLVKHSLKTSCIKTEHHESSTTRSSFEKALGTKVKLDCISPLSFVFKVKRGNFAVKEVNTKTQEQHDTCDYVLWNYEIVNQEVYNDLQHFFRQAIEENVFFIQVWHNTNGTVLQNLLNTEPFWDKGPEQVQEYLLDTSRMIYDDDGDLLEWAEGRIKLRKST